MDKLRAQSKKLKFLRFFLFLIVIAICDMRYAICDLLAQDKIIAIVNNDVITQKDLKDFINFMRIQLAQEYKEELESKIQSIKMDLIDRLIEDRLILQEAKKNKIKIEDSLVKARIDEIKKQYPSDIEFQKALASQGLVQADIETKIKEQLLMYNILDTKIRGKIVVNPQEVTDFYEDNIEQFKLPEAREFESITFEDENLAREIFSKLKDGQDLQELAGKFTLSVNKLSTMKDGQLKREIQDLVFKLNLKEVSEPIKIEDKYYIFKLNNIIPSRQQSLLEVKDRIYLFLFNKKMQEELTRWLDELKKDAYIKIMQD